VLKVFHSIRVIFLLVSFVFCAVFANAQSGQSDASAKSSDWHLSSQGARVFFTRSAFAHGYMHGYEEGFHRGDLDLQMTRSFQPLRYQPKYKKICGYRTEFGDRSTFEEGYRKGYAVGYTDSYSGREFRALQLVREGKAATSAGDVANPDERLDRSFIAGYENGQKAGLEDGRAATAVAVLNSIDCTNALGKSAKPTGDYCAAYKSGYRLGYSDGYTNQRGAAEVFARK
jgi:flagellar biosynthesis/type III secretory pathway protein FliH